MKYLVLIKQIPLRYYKKFSKISDKFLEFVFRGTAHTRELIIKLLYKGGGHNTYYSPENLNSV